MVTVTTSLPAGDAVDQAAIDQWIYALPKEFDKDDLVYLRTAAILALDVGAGIRLWSGETQLRHALSVAEILSGLRLDRETLAAAILLGVLTSDAVNLDLLTKRFGANSARMADDLDRIGRLTDVSSEVSAEAAPGRPAPTSLVPPRKADKMEHAENLRRLLLGIAEDVRVVLVVVAERLHLMRIARELPDEIRRRLAEETRDIYAPLANRLGIWQIKWELEDLMLRFLQPQEYKQIARQLDGRRADRERFIHQVIQLLHEKFREVGVKAEINGRPKHIYSIWRKMQRKAVDIEQIFDLRAVRVLVDDIAQCYAALGVVHGLWRHIPGEFDDYIATPKANMYQSIHTAVTGPEGKTMEVQIRTRDMHHHSELGVAAHWRYKENTKHDADFERRIVWMRHWLELKDGGNENSGFLDPSNSQLETTRIYVLTPQGKVVELPKGSTALDFAYAIHSDVGHHCRGAKVDGHIVQLTRPLCSGETVEVLTAKNGTPSRDWINPHLGYLHTSKARNRVKQWFKRQDFEHHVDQGRAALEREMTRLAVTLRPDLGALAPRYNLRSADDVLAAIGRGDISPVQIAGFGGQQKPEPAETPIVQQRQKRSAKGEVMVAGVDDLMTSMARCCKPVPYDDIVGFVTRGRGVTIHRRDCSNIRSMDEEERERLVQVSWSEEQTEAAYPVDILIHANDRKGLLRDISTIFTNDEVDVIAVNTSSDRKNDTATMQFTVEVTDMEQLRRLLARVEQLPEVIEVKRQI
ncbi:MAG: bifunctional (p)ppGpp synthetase/guanosine-3',5'-bis(diphosphate) 3'-pyrophosphohydrolase [Pseudomonadota bacterium]